MSTLEATFTKEAPEVMKVYDGLVKTLNSLKGLDDKTKKLIFFGIKVTERDVNSVAYFVPVLKKLGATREEIRDTVLLSLAICGLSGVSACLGPAMEIYDRS